MNNFSTLSGIAGILQNHVRVFPIIQVNKLFVCREIILGLTTQQLHFCKDVLTSMRRQIQIINSLNREKVADFVRKVYKVYKVL